MSRWFLVVPAMLLMILALSCRNEEPRIVIENGKPVVEERNKPENRIRIAVGGMITPKEGVAYYREFLDSYVQEKLGMEVEYVDREDYGEINEMLRSGQLNAAFVCSGPYVDGHKQFGLELLVAPQAYGAPVYYSYIIVAKESRINSFDELRGKRFAFTDPLSNTGKLVPTYMLAQMDETPEAFFKSFIYTKSHDKSIKAVAQGVVDAAAVDSLIWEFLDKTNPEFTSKTRILKKSPPYGIPPVVVPRDLDPELKEKLKRVFLDAHTNPKGRKMLKKMMIEKFVVISDSAYDSIRGMKEWVAKGKAMDKRE